ncbi:MAG: D-2-hydroxyacid dehydrogenase [Planctomycetota bacterium]
MKITVLDGYTLNPGDNPWTELEALGELTVYDRTPETEILERASTADIVLTNKTFLDAGTLQSLPKLKFISVLATGHNVVDTDAARSRGIPVSNVPEYGTPSVAQHVLAMMLHFARQCALHSQRVHEGEWRRSIDFCFWKTPQVELVGKRLGIVGFGRIGRCVGQLAHALGMEVLAFDARRNEPPDYTPFAWRSIEEIFAESDFVTMHCPQTAENAGMVNRGLLEKMQAHAIFINTARGGLVNEEDLATALNEGKIGGAALDVLSVEPPSADNPLLQAKNCLITPHIAWATLEARRRLMAITVENVRAFLRGTPRNVVNAAP